MKSLAHLLPRRHLHFLGAHNSRKIKNKIGFRFFASFERVSNSGSLGCVGLCESVQFSVRRNQTYREMIIFLLAAEAGDLRYGKPISCCFIAPSESAVRFIQAKIKQRVEVNFGGVGQEFSRIFFLLDYYL